MSRTDSQVNFRLPPDLRQKLQNAADEAKRSLTAEMVMRLESSFKSTGAAEADLIHRTVQSVLAGLVQFGGLDLNTVRRMAETAEAEVEKDRKRRTKKRVNPSRRGSPGSA